MIINDDVEYIHECIQHNYSHSRTDERLCVTKSLRKRVVTSLYPHVLRIVRCDNLYGVT